MTEPIGPVYAGGLEVFAEKDGNGEEYRILYLPDKNNSELQKEGKAPHYYWMPGSVRIARDGNGNAKFRLLQFLGVRDNDSHVGGDSGEIAGGSLTVTTTARPPDAVLKRAHQKLMKKFQGDPDTYWGARSSMPPEIGPMPIVSSRTSMSNLSIEPDGRSPRLAAARSGPAVVPRVVRRGRSVDTRAIDQPTQLGVWYARLEGAGPGSIDIGGENAFSALLGSYPTALLWEGFRGATSNVVVNQALKLRVWSENISLHIQGDWQSIFDHFSAHAQGRIWWIKGDIKSEFDRMMTSGAIKVDMMIDDTRGGDDEEQQKRIRDRLDLILDKFMQLAEKAIFDPAPTEVDPAKLSETDEILADAMPGVSFALKAKREEAHLTLDYQETFSQAFLLDHVISSSLRGFFDDIKVDLEAERRYFQKIFLDDWGRKVSRIVRPVVGGSKDEVEFISCQVGYPDTQGKVQWVGRDFDKSNFDEPWQSAFSMKQDSDMQQPPPEGWRPDSTFLKRRIHFREISPETGSELRKTYIEKNQVDLDPGDNGTLVNDITNEIRVESAGVAQWGPIFLNAELDNSKQLVDVTFLPTGKTHDGHKRKPATLLWKFNDQSEPRYVTLYSGQPAVSPRLKYQVRVTVKGGLTTKGQMWTGDWQTVSSTGDLIINVPTPDEAISQRSLTPREVISRNPVPPPKQPHEPSDDTSIGPPPSDTRPLKAA